MTTILSTTGTIFFIIVIGYIAVARTVFSQDNLQILGKYVVNLALPALIFRAVSESGASEILNVGYLMGYLLGSLSVLILGYVFSRFMWKASPISSTFDATGMACANSGFVGYPILVMTLPAIAPTALALNMVVENLVIIPLVLLLAEYASAPTQNRRSMLKLVFHRIGTNPIVLAMAVGILFAISDLSLPTFTSNAIDLIAQSSIAVSLFVIGGTVAGTALKTVGKRVISVVIGKLIFLPFAVWIGFGIMDLTGVGVNEPDLRKAAIIMAATPTMSVYPILAQQYGQEEHASTAMLIMIAMSFFTISGLLYIL